VLERLVNRHPASLVEDAQTMPTIGASLRVWVAKDGMGTLYRDAIMACAHGELQGSGPQPEPEPQAQPEGLETTPRHAEERSGWRHPVLLLLPLKLGLGRHIHPRYARTRTRVIGCSAALMPSAVFVQLYSSHRCIVPASPGGMCNHDAQRTTDSQN
jgi:hypothetical protein